MYEYIYVCIYIIYDRAGVGLGIVGAGDAEHEGQKSEKSADFYY
jgi:hypothetical protein